MRTKPFDFSGGSGGAGAVAEEAKTGAGEQSFEDSIVFDLKKEFQRPKSEPPKPEAKPEPATGTDEEVIEENDSDPEQSEATPGSAKLRSQVEETKKQIEKELEQAITDPKGASLRALKFLNFIRQFAYPWVYKKILFEKPELPYFDSYLEKSLAAKATGKMPDFNDAEKTISEKAEFYLKEKLGAKWTEQELTDYNDIAYMKIAEIKFFRWLMQNDWIIAFLIIEGKRLGPVIGYRFGFKM